jgi:hypothetical protein
VAQRVAQLPDRHSGAPGPRVVVGHELAVGAAPDVEIELDRANASG